MEIVQTKQLIILQGTKQILRKTQRFCDMLKGSMMKVNGQPVPDKMKLIWILG